ncbi:MAG: nucleoside 2-deoxyribosyltransferase [Flavisolibacter sp.]|nr:nucleoside 2-deoxyribosyltransferase [Flavisolibacter sp.]
MTAYISVSFRKKEVLSKELTAITDALNGFNIQAFVFVDNYAFSPAQEKQMMQQAMHDIDRCDLLIAETSDKGIGIGIEVGYAKAKNKPVIYVRHNTAEHSTTVLGISDFQIVYVDADDLKKQLFGVLKLLSEMKLH